MSLKLGAVQKRILIILARGQKVLHGHRDFAYLDDGSVCMEKTILTLREMGLVELDANQSIWMATEAGRLIGDKLRIAKKGV
jgi:hypothetical protein